MKKVQPQVIGKAIVIMELLTHFPSGDSVIRYHSHTLDSHAAFPIRYIVPRHNFYITYLHTYCTVFMKNSIKQEVR